MPSFFESWRHQTIKNLLFIYIRVEESSHVKKKNKTKKTTKKKQQTTKESLLKLKNHCDRKQCFLVVISKINLVGK